MSLPTERAAATLAQRIDAALPQTQCTRCGYPDCAGYAHAIATGAAAINRCPPGGAEGIDRLSALTGLPRVPLDPAFGVEAPRQLAVIDEAWCIGCTLCIQACPTDAILGAPKAMHTVIAARCTGCELCLPVCPVDCIELEKASAERTGWQAWSAQQAAQAKDHYHQRTVRLQREADRKLGRREREAQAVLADLSSHSTLTNDAVLARKRSVIEDALARARDRSRTRPPVAAD
ncbi:MAG: electron transport complex subunit RsxB [Burkholderiaceae bacterium]